MMGYGDMGGGVWWLWMIVPTLVVLGLIWWGIVWSGDHRRTDYRDSPRDILDRRYAAGDIDREEYERRRRDLAGSR